MGLLANGTSLRTDPTFRSWVQTAILYNARLVLLDDSAAPVADQPVRQRLAIDAASQSETMTALFLVAIACSPDIIGPPNNWSTPIPDMEQPIIDMVAGLWTHAAHVAYPNGV